MKLTEYFKKIDFHNPRLQLMCVIFLVGAFGMYWYYEKSIVIKREEVNQLRQTYESKQNELVHILSMKPKLEELTASLQQMNQDLEFLRAKFPDSKQIPHVLQKLTFIAAKVGISATKFIPQKDKEHEYYRENNYLMSIDGGYHELARFFAELANFELMINVSNVSIRVSPLIRQSIAENDEHGTGVRTITSTFQLTTFSSNK